MIAWIGAANRDEKTSATQSVRVTVQDDEPGISEDVLPQIFQRFVTGNDGENDLGLAISRARKSVV